MPKYRSKFEANIAADLKRRQIDYEYEAVELPYVTSHIYTPDWKLKNGVIIESKGYMPAATRALLIKVKQTYPDLDIRLLFMDPTKKLSKASKTTYGQWASKHGFPWAAGTRIPDNWTTPQ